MLPPLMLALGLLSANGLQLPEPTPPAAELAHVQNTFRFALPASFGRVAPFFGPEGERAWAGPHWNPEFLYPQPATDTEGAVFKVQHGQHTSLWVNTLFDLPNGRMQYVAILDDLVVSIVNVRLTAIDPSHTAVEVTYTRTALQPAANAHVRAMGDSDRDSGPDWQSSIEKCLLVQTK